MAVVVLLRGANLGNRRFSPKAVESDLKDLGVTSVGAAGTFVVSKAVPAARLVRRLDETLPFDPRAIIVSDAQVLAAIAAGDKSRPPAGCKLFATAMDKRPKGAKLPLDEPRGRWGVRVVSVVGPIALGFRRPVAATGVYPNPVIEKAWGVRATTRDWPTMEKVGALLG